MQHEDSIVHLRPALRTAGAHVAGVKPSAAHWTAQKDQSFVSTRPTALQHQFDAQEQGPWAAPEVCPYISIVEVSR
eukprot:Skav213376  [mRNA]  locus=scaffold797:137499:142030:- [translate_table: standard]